MYITNQKLRLAWKLHLTVESVAGVRFEKTFLYAVKKKHGLIGFRRSFDESFLWKNAYGHHAPVRNKLFHKSLVVHFGIASPAPGIFTVMWTECFAFALSRLFLFDKVHLFFFIFYSERRANFGFATDTDWKRGTPVGPNRGGAATGGRWASKFYHELSNFRKMVVFVIFIMVVVSNSGTYGSLSTSFAALIGTRSLEIRCEYSIFIHFSASIFNGQEYWYAWVSSFPFLVL